MNEFYGMIILIIYLIFCLLITKILYKKNYLNQNFSRKFLHILLSNIFLLLISFIDNLYLAISIPLCFIFINYLIHHYHLFQAIDRKEDHLGIVYYAISFFLIVLFSYLFGLKQEGALCILILGYGDGLAGLIGSTIGKHSLLEKTWEGSITLFISVFLLCLIFSFPVSFSFVVATISMLIELLSKRGLDNLYLPLASFFLIFILTIYPNFLYPLMILSFHFLLALVFYSLKKLTLAGSMFAILIGFSTYYFLGGLAFGALLLFLVGSNLIEKFRIRKIPKESKPRRLTQVLANGGIPFLMVLGYGLFPTSYFIVLFFTTLASANSDTLSGEIGQMGHGKVKSILKRIEVEKGLSGGVTKLGFIGGFLGAMLIAILSYFKMKGFSVFLFVTAFGFLGTVIDSILGELLEAKYYNKEKNKIMEEENGTLFSGYSFITNNIVNFSSNFLVFLLASLFYLLFF